jgi:mRNA interferase MazF
MEMNFMHKGEIWLINLDPTIGAEIQKSRPAVIVSVDEIGILPLRVIVPITDWKDQYSQAAWMVPILPGTKNGLNKRSAADAFQIRSVSKERFIRKIGVLEIERLNMILSAIQIMIGIG